MQGDDIMEPEMKSMPAFTVVGMKYRGKNKNNEIPALWEKFGPKMGEIKHIIGPAYGVMDNYDEKSGEFDYIAGFKVETASDIPEGMVSKDVPEQTYAVGICTLPTIREVCEYLYHTWLPQSGFNHAHGPEFELYDENFDPEDEKSKMYIYIPVVKA
jgi:AraC family transcriptional regulator